MIPFGRKLLWASRRTPALTPEEVTSHLSPQGCGVTKLQRPAPDELRERLTTDQHWTIQQLEDRHDTVELDRVLEECGTAWVICTNYDSGGREITHHIITKAGLPI